MKRDTGPSVGRLLARLLLPRDHRESVLGDLEELHPQRVRTLGPTRAAARYVRDVLASSAAIAIRRRRSAVEPRDASLGSAAASRFTALGPDSKLALRMLVKNPMLTIVGGLGMAVAIAMAIGMFTFLTFYYSHPPFDEGERIVAVGNVNVNVRVDDSMRSSLFEYHVWRDQLESVDDIAAYRDVPGRLEIAGGGGGLVPLAVMTASAFQAARVPPLLGRYLLEADELEDAPPVVVIGYEEWQRDFGSDPDVVGREVRLDGSAHTVVGVMPQGFRFPLNHGYWTPLRTDRSLYAPGEGPEIHVFGRLAPGVGLPAARAEVAAIGGRLEEETPALYEDVRADVVPYVRHLLDVQQYPAWVIWSMQLLGALLLALIAVNVAVLFYARTAIRRAEMTVRTALGAARGRIVRQLFVEALALSVLAATLGLAIAEVGYRRLTAISDLEDDLPYWLFGGLPWEAVPYALGLAVLAAFIIGVLPALQATGRDLQSTLREMGGATGVRMGRTWTVLIVVQVAVAVAALPPVVGIAWEQFPSGPPTPRFPAEESFTFRLVPTPGSAADAGSAAARAAADQAALQVELLQRVESLPGVAGVTFASGHPASRFQRPIEIEGTDVDFISQGGAVTQRVDPAYFDVLGASMLAGRPLGPADRAADATAVVVNRSFVEVHLEGGAALGRRVRYPNGLQGRGPEDRSPWYEIVGVVEDLYVVSERTGRGVPAMYRAIAAGGDAPTILVRARGIAPEDRRARICDVVRDVAPECRMTGQPLDEYQTNDAEQFAFIAALVGLITTSVLLLSAAGVSALMSFAVTRRRREIGIRTALGASRGRVVTSVFARSTRQLALGLLLGAAGAALVDRMTGGEMLGDRAPWLLALVGALMLLAGLLATLGPARRALGVQPMEALRQE